MECDGRGQFVHPTSHSGATSGVEVSKHTCARGSSCELALCECSSWVSPAQSLYSCASSCTLGIHRVALPATVPLPSRKALRLRVRGQLLEICRLQLTPYCGVSWGALVQGCHRWQPNSWATRMPRYSEPCAEVTFRKSLIRSQKDFCSLELRRMGSRRRPVVYKEEVFGKHAAGDNGNALAQHVSRLCTYFDTRVG